jgi:hypothetical protein
MQRRRSPVACPCFMGEVNSALWPEEFVAANEVFPMKESNRVWLLNSWVHSRKPKFKIRNILLDVGSTSQP